MLAQFGNNWIQKILLTAKLAVLGIFFIQLFPNWTACRPITYTNLNTGFARLINTHSVLFGNVARLNL